MMRSSEIRAILAFHLSTSVFATIRVCASNELPPVVNDTQKPALFVVNTDPNYCQGSHWVVIVLFPILPSMYSHRLQAYFFDPLACSPSHYVRSLKRFLHANSAPVSRAVNSLKIQPRQSLSCGYYCTYFALRMNEFQHNPFRTVYAMFNLTESMIIRHVLEKWQRVCHEQQI